MSKKGFTLAEVLITLGIIGVVAAMTLPTLIAKYKKSEVETALKKFYSIMNHAVLLSVSENGETKYWTFASESTFDGIDAFYKKYFSDYIKKIKIGKTNINGKDVFTVYYVDGSAAAVGYNGHDWIYCTEANALPHNHTLLGRKFFDLVFIQMPIAEPDHIQTKIFITKE